jgi:hypothetical protein
MNIVRRLLNEHTAKKLTAARGEALFLTLLRRGRPGGLDVTRQDAEGAAALMWLLASHKRRAEITIVKNRKNLTLMFKDDLNRTFSPGVVAGLDRAGITALPEEDLHGPDDAQP